MAKRLHRRLETYRVPKELVGHPGRDGPVPRRLIPVFRDMNELPASADVGGNLREALTASQVLVVLAYRTCAIPLGRRRDSHLQKAGT